MLAGGTCGYHSQLLLSVLRAPWRCLLLVSKVVQTECVTLCVCVGAQPEQVCICVYAVPRLCVCVCECICENVCVYLHECAYMCTSSSLSPTQEQPEDRADDVQEGWRHVLMLVSHTGEGQGCDPR